MNNTENEFDFQPITPEQQLERRRKLISIGLILGGMLLALIIGAVILISYSAGFTNGKDSSTTTVSPTEEAKEAASLDEESAKYYSKSEVGKNEIPDHARGTSDSKIRVITYADFTCSYCVRLALNMPDVYDRYDDQVQFIYRNYSIGNTYSGVTQKIAEAAYIVGGDNAYWKVLDQIYNDEIWLDGTYMDTQELNNKIIAYGKEIGVSGQKLLDEYNDSANNGITTKIERDRKLAKQSNIQGTPTVFVNGKEVRSSLESITAEIDSLLE